MASSDERLANKVNGIIDNLNINEKTKALYKQGRVQTFLKELENLKVKLSPSEIKSLKAYAEQKQVQIKSTRQKVLGGIAIAAGILFFAAGAAVTFLTGGLSSPLTLPFMAIGAEIAAIGAGIAGFLGLTSIIGGSFAVNFGRKNQTKADKMSKEPVEENTLLAEQDSLASEDTSEQEHLDTNLASVAPQSNRDQLEERQNEALEYSTSADDAYSSGISDTAKDDMTVMGQYDTSVSESEEPSSPVMPTSEKPESLTTKLPGRVEKIVRPINNAAKINEQKQGNYKTIHKNSLTSVLHQMNENSGAPKREIPAPTDMPPALPHAATPKPLPKMRASTNANNTPLKSDPPTHSEDKQPELMEEDKSPKKNTISVNWVQPKEMKPNLKKSANKNLFYSLGEMQNVLKLFDIQLANDHPYTLMQAAQQTIAKQSDYPNVDKSPFYKLAFLLHELALFQSVSLKNPVKNASYQKEWVKSNLEEMKKNLEHITDNHQLERYYTALRAASNSKGSLKIADKLKHSSYQSVTDFKQDILSHIKLKRKCRGELYQAIAQHYETMSTEQINRPQNTSAVEKQTKSPEKAASNTTGFFNKSTRGANSAPDLLNQIKRGVTLNKTDHTEQPQAAAENDLLAQIRKGTPLKKSSSDNLTETKKEQSTDIWSQMAAKIESYSSSSTYSTSTESSEDDSDDENDWGDSDSPKL